MVVNVVHGFKSIYQSVCHGSEFVNAQFEEKVSQHRTIAKVGAVVLMGLGSGLTIFGAFYGLPKMAIIFNGGFIKRFVEVIFERSLSWAKPFIDVSKAFISQAKKTSSIFFKIFNVLLSGMFVVPTALIQLPGLAIGFTIIVSTFSLPLLPGLITLKTGVRMWHTANKAM